MTTVQSQITDQKNLEPFFYLRISGLPYYFFATIDPSNSRYGSFAWSTPTAYSSGWNRGGLMLPDDTIDQKLQDIIGGIATPGRIRLSMIDFPDPAAPGFGFLARLFAPGRFIADSTITKAQLTESVHFDSTELHVSGADATFPNTSADVYLGAETIGISASSGPDGAGASTLTIAARNKYACFGNTQDDPDTVFPPIPYHRVALAPDGSGNAGAQVSTAPAAVLGRLASLWIGNIRPDGNPEPESSSTCLLLGRITNLDIGKVGGTFDITIESITADLQGAQVAPDLGQGTLFPGVYITNRWKGFVFKYVTMVNDSTQANVTAGVSISPGTYTLTSLAAAVNAAIQAIDVHDDLSNQIIHGLTLITVAGDDAGSPRFRFHLLDPNNGPFPADAVITTTVTVECDQTNSGTTNTASLLAALGFDTGETSFQFVQAEGIGGVNLDVFVCDAQQPTPVLFIPTRFLEGFETSTTVPLNTLTGQASDFFLDQLDGSGVAYVRLGDGQIVKLVDKDDTSNTLSLGMSTTGFGDSEAGFYYVPFGGTGTVEQVAIIVDRPGIGNGGHAIFLGQLLASTAGQTRGTLNVMPEGVGMGWLSLLTENDWLIDNESGINRRVYADRAMTFADIFGPIAREHGLFLVWDPSTSKIRLRTMQVPQRGNASTFTLSESNRSTAGDRTTQRLDLTSLRTSWKIQAGWDWATQQWTQGPFVINDVVSRTNYPNNARQESIEDKTLFLAPQLGAAIGQRLELYGSAWTSCQRSVNKTGLLLAPGSFHHIIDNTMVNPVTGAYGIASGDRVYGMLTGVSVNPGTGEVGATFVVNSADDNSLYRPWSPSGLVDFSATSNGYVSSTKTLTMAMRYTNQSGKYDGADFLSGDAIRVSNRDRLASDYAYTDVIASVSTDGRTITLVSGLGHSLSSTTDSILMLDTFSSQSTDRKTGDDSVAWQGDGVQKMVDPPSGIRLNKWS